MPDPDRAHLIGDEIEFRGFVVARRPERMPIGFWEAFVELATNWIDEDAIRAEAYDEGRDAAFDEEIANAEASRLAKLKDKLKRKRGK